MKKIAALGIAMMVLLVALVGCGSNEDSIASHITIKEQEVTLGGVYDDALAQGLGAPNETKQAVSCHYDGYDTMYYYDGFTIYTYLLEDQQVMYSVEVTDPSIKTPEGAAVGMTIADIEKIYGTTHDELPNGISYALKGEGSKLNFRVKDDAVFCIEYYTE